MEKDGRADPPPRGVDAARAATLRQESATTRRTELGQVRAAVRTQLADSQRHRQELSQSRLAMRHSIAELLNQVRARRREFGHESATRRAHTKS